ncbi:MAG: transcription-repair coupling factor [Verrucomicrobiae bacterium]|nr:transcription-repair coupling factor [Verrucomicrobiae bacterium]
MLSLDGVAAPAQPFLVAALRRLFPERSLVVVTEHLKAQEQFHQDLTTWLQPHGPASDSPPEARSDRLPAPAAPLFYPAWETLPHEGRLPHVDVISERLATLVALDGAPPPPAPAPLVVTNAVALLQKTFSPAALRARTRVLARGDRADPLDLVEWLEAHGYEPEAQVTQKGEIALRGGILDVFPLTAPWPVRLEFFGDEIESLREFDPLTQVSRGEISRVTLPPAGEWGILKRELDRAGEPGADAAQTAAHSGDLASTLLAHLPERALLVLCEPELLEERVREYAAQIPPGDRFHVSWAEFLAAARQSCIGRVELRESDAAAGALAPPLFVSLEAWRPLPERPPELQVAEAQRRGFFAQLHRWLRQGYAVEVFCNNQGERQRFEEIWREFGLEGEPARRPQAQIGSLARGFLCEAAKLVVVTDAEIFGRYRVQRPRRLKLPGAATTRSVLDLDFTELEAGDLVVHLQHGIGRYLGLKTLPATVGKRSAPNADETAGIECLVIEYAPRNPGDEPPKLYVPVTEAHLVSKYVGAGRARPPLNTLGGARWRQAKARAERAVRDIAAELLAIQAARESQPGHAFAPDTPWQREFEAAFIYEETPDQWRAIQETKADMERPRPMDRLICGDAGFGKTEVAIRAAFKAVMDGKQVAVLVPTTVLAQQHFNTFRERMADYPIRIELLSRFRTRREQQRIVRDLASGSVDIVIGTHRLLQEDITFKDLGLVVIDEEQRFGVLHKEKFKQLRTLVDVLTLTATPIPRTLYLALAGARDMSTIQTPPQDRLPVETIVCEYDERVIRDAILRELNRGGQVYFLHNRVMTIDLMADRLRRLVPQARLVVGHGQMHSDELEEVMTRFVNGEADVLLSTTIIESGLDIPNANTIIIDRADRFGLSDLYQLRGRVGRYKHQAYAYLLLPRHARLLTDVRKRLSAIRQFSSLGSGFKIAMRDLEIRGAGNLLGPEQSGHITAVGFDLYCQLLRQSIAVLKGEPVKPRVEVAVRLDFLETNAVGSETPPDEARQSRVRACLPHDYVTEPQHRIEMYRKLAQATDRTALEALRSEMRDRFGPLPPPVERLLLVAELKLLAAEKGVGEIEVRDDRLMLMRAGDFVTVGGKFPRLSRKSADARLKEIKKFLLAL